MALIAALGLATLLLVLFFLRVGTRGPDAVVVLPGELEELPPSSLHLPILYDPAPLLGALEEVVPARIGNLTDRRPHPSDPALRYAFQAERDPFEVELRGDTVHLSTVIHYGGQMWYTSPFGGELTAHCGVAEAGATPPRARIRLSSPLELEGDWTVRTQMRVGEIGPLTPEDRCRATFLQMDLDVTDLIMTAAELWLEDQTGAVDSVLGNLDLLPYVETFWEALRSPIPLADGVWLLLDPTALAGGSLGGMDADEPNIRSAIGITARPRIVMGSPPAASSTPLPPLDTEAHPESVSILLDSQVDYPYLSELLTWALRDDPIQIAGRELRVREVRAESAGEQRLAVDLEVEGAFQGRVHLVGTPVFDSSSGEITVPDLDFTIEDGSVLVRAGAWVARTGFPGYIRSQVRFPASDFLEAGRALAATGMSHQLSAQARLEGSVDSIEIVQLSATPTGLVVRSQVVGDARLVVVED